MENKLFEFISTLMPLDEEEKSAINELALFRKYEKGEIIRKEGDLSNESYFVISGCLRTYYLISGEEINTAFYTEFEAVTTNKIGTTDPSAYYLACVENSILAISNPSMEKTIFDKFPRFETLCRILSEQLLAKNQASFDSFRTLTPEQRYLDLLSKRPDLVQRVPQYQLASFLGIKPESLSRIRKRLVTQDKKKVAILTT